MFTNLFLIVVLSNDDRKFVYDNSDKIENNKEEFLFYIHRYFFSLCATSGKKI